MRRRSSTRVSLSSLRIPCLRHIVTQPADLWSATGGSTHSDIPGLQTVEIIIRDMILLRHHMTYSDIGDLQPIREQPPFISSVVNKSVNLFIIRN